MIVALLAAGTRGYLFAAHELMALAQPVHQMSGNWVVLPAMISIRRGPNERVEEQTVICLSVERSKAMRYVESINNDGTINRRWFPIEEVDR